MVVGVAREPSKIVTFYFFSLETGDAAGHYQLLLTLVVVAAASAVLQRRRFRVLLGLSFGAQLAGGRGLAGLPRWGAAATHQQLTSSWTEVVVVLLKPARGAGEWYLVITRPTPRRQRGVYYRIFDYDVGRTVIISRTRSRLATLLSLVF